MEKQHGHRGRVDDGTAAREAMLGPTSRAQLVFWSLRPASTIPTAPLSVVVGAGNWKGLDRRKVVPVLSAVTPNDLNRLDSVVSVQAEDPRAWRLVEWTSEETSRGTRPPDG